MKENKEISPEEQMVISALEKLGISCTRHEHPPVYTVDEAVQHWKGITGAHCKNLFLRNKKGNRHYLVILEHQKRADLKELSWKLGEDRLSFGSADRLKRFLGLEPGSVSPFGILNDEEKQVRVVIDQDLRGESRVNFHPNVNTATLGISFADFEKFLEWRGNTFRFIQI